MPRTPRHHRMSAPCIAVGLMISLLASCGGGGGGGGGSQGVDLAPAKQVKAPGIESYTTDHNGYSRARVTPGKSAADKKALAKFDDASPASPAGYRSLIDLAETKYAKTMMVEVIAEVTTGSGKGAVTRILRVTADQAPFKNRATNGQRAASGKYYFRGENQVWASVDGGPVQTGKGELVNMVADFDKQTVSLDIRTPYNPGAGSDIETTLKAERLTLNIDTGTFGGAVKLSTRSAVDGKIVTAPGVLRGNMSADTAGLTRQVENMTTSGLYSIAGKRLTADGVFYGSQLNDGS